MPAFLRLERRIALMLHFPPVLCLLAQAGQAAVLASGVTAEPLGVGGPTQNFVGEAPPMMVPLFNKDGILAVEDC